MNQYKLKVVNREEVSRGAVRRLRAAGQIPANVYGKGEARAIQVSAVEFRDLSREIAGEAALVELNDDKGETTLTQVKSVQRNAIKGGIDHIDFQLVTRGEAMTTKIPVSLVNESECVGVKIDGGMVEVQVHEVEVRCRPSKMPDNVPVDVAELKAGSSIHVRDLPEIDGVEYLGNEDTVVVACAAAKVVAAESTAAGDAEPAAEGASAEEEAS
ncbi:MAG: 50S ribosomal protein L25, partial [Coraliomargarita sp.]